MSNNNQNSFTFSMKLFRLWYVCWSSLFFSHLQYETTDKHLSPDGQYVPRIIFVGKSYSL